LVIFSARAPMSDFRATLMRPVLSNTTIALVALGFYAVDPASARTFGGYDCTDDCVGHAAGYRWAEEREIEYIDECPENRSEAFYVKDASPTWMTLSAALTWMTMAKKSPSETDERRKWSGPGMRVQWDQPGPVRSRGTMRPNGVRFLLTPAASCPCISDRRRSRSGSISLPSFAKLDGHCRVGSLSELSNHDNRRALGRAAAELTCCGTMSAARFRSSAETRAPSAN
jgi:hypothetical protein